MNQDKIKAKYITYIQTALKNKRINYMKQKHYQTKQEIPHSDEELNRLSDNNLIRFFFLP
ncbi:hypothetical protein AGMMS50284_7330 [Clostridia bacterium]|nr:hypothetical protein AGMMS50284_7330 [Clostridia bacterium]